MKKKLSGQHIEGQIYSKLAKLSYICFWSMDIIISCWIQNTFVSFTVMSGVGVDVTYHGKEAGIYIL